MTDLQRRFGLVAVCVLTGVLLWAASPPGFVRMVALLLIGGGLVAAVTNLLAKPSD